MAETTTWPRLPAWRRDGNAPRSTHVGYQLVAAGMLIMTGGHDGKPLDDDELERWTRVGYERGHARTGAQNFFGAQNSYLIRTHNTRACTRVGARGNHPPDDDPISVILGVHLVSLRI